MTIPILISFRDRVTWAKALAEFCRELPDASVIVCDNASEYPPAVEWLRWLEATPGEGIEVHRLGSNCGPRGAFRVSRGGASHYVVTDQDMGLTGVPSDVLQVLREGLDTHLSAVKAGLQLRVDDLPDTELARDARRQEAPFWTRPFTDDAGRQWYHADVDTTFAMYREALPHGVYGPAVRLGGEYQARHLSLYLTPETIDAEHRHYLEHGTAVGVYYTAKMRERLWHTKKDHSETNL